LANAKPDNKVKVRKKLRTPAQLLAHSSARHKRRGLQSINPLIFKKQVRNFLRTPPNPHATAFHQQRRTANKSTAKKRSQKKAPNRRGFEHSERLKL
jgi:hypothetical protein